MAVVEIARGSVCWEEGRRQEGEIFRVLGDIVRAMA